MSTIIIFRLAVLSIFLALGGIWGRSIERHTHTCARIQLWNATRQSCASADGCDGRVAASFLNNTSECGGSEVQAALPGLRVVAASIVAAGANAQQAPGAWNAAREACEVAKGSDCSLEQLRLMAVLFRWNQAK